jgi:hypothetical protein
MLTNNPGFRMNIGTKKFINQNIYSTEEKITEQDITEIEESR